MSLSLLSNLLTPSQQFLSGVLSSARRFFGNDPSRMAQALSGTSNKKSPEYKSELRNVQRWYTSGKEKRAPGTKSLFQLARYVGWQIHLTFGDIYTRRFRSIHVRLDPQDVSTIRGALLRGDTAQAISSIFDAYGYNPFAAGNVRNLDIRSVQTI